MLRFALALAILSLASPLQAQRHGRSRSSGTGVKCGRSYISASKTCHIGEAETPEPSAHSPSDTVRANSDARYLANMGNSDMKASPLDTSRARATFVGNALTNAYFPVGCAVAALVPDEYRVFFEAEKAALLLKMTRVPGACR